jgi:hypothetical protein
MRMAVPLFRIKSIALAHIPIKGEFPQFAGRAQLATASFVSLSQFETWWRENSELTAVWQEEDEAAVSPESFALSIPGFCAVCDKEVDFFATTEYGSAGDPNWREQLICPSCHMRNRMRAALHLSIQEFGMTQDKKIYITEQFGSGYRWMCGHFAHVSGSEYLFPGKASGTRKLGISHQDVQDLSFASSTFDYVLTFDVLEHVPDYNAAFTSFARILRPGGRLIMTVPFTIHKQATTVRAVMHPDGQIEYLLPIEVHGNPTDPINGALCYRHFGWDTLSQLTAAGFTDATVHVYHNRELGYLGGAQSLISAIRAS